MGWDFREIEKMILLQMIDKAWKGHLYDLDHLKKSIFLRAYGQKDPKVEYQKESFRMFEAMLARIRQQTVEYLFKVEAPKAAPPPRIMVDESSSPAAPPPKPAGPARSILSGGSGAPHDVRKIGRNDPCFCGSSKKYKKCHGAGSDS